VAKDNEAWISHHLTIARGPMCQCLQFFWGGEYVRAARELSKFMEGSPEWLEYREHYVAKHTEKMWQYVLKIRRAFDKCERECRAESEWMEIQQDRMKQMLDREKE
jgi:hypothetical protein